MLSEENRDRHGIYSPVCLYSQRDLEQLMESGGFTVDHIWSSKFGNVKGAFKKSV
jgi:hypothetical protein